MFDDKTIIFENTTQVEKQDQIMAFIDPQLSLGDVPLSLLSQLSMAKSRLHQNYGFKGAEGTNLKFAEIKNLDVFPHILVENKDQGEGDMDMSTKPLNFNDFAGLFSRDEICAYVGMFGRKEKEYFRKVTNFAPGISAGVRPKTLLSIFNVATLAKLVMTMGLPSFSQHPCDCIFHFRAMRETRPHKCALCGGISIVDEKMTFLTSSPRGQSVRRLLYDNRFVFTPNGYIVLHKLDQIFSGQITTEEDLIIFGMGVLDGTWPEVQFTEDVDNVINRISQSHGAKAGVEEIARERIAQKDGIVICRVELCDNVPVKTLLFDVSTKTLAILPGTASVAEYIKPGSMVVDPKIFLYVDGLNGCWGPGGKDLPCFNGVYGYAAFGYIKEGSAFVQIRNEIAQVFGIGIRCDITQLGFGIHFFDDTWSEPVSRYVVPFHRGMVLCKDVPKCVICTKPLPKRPGIKVAGRITGTPEYVECDPMCNLCAQLPIMALKEDFKSFFHQLGLDQLSVPECTPASGQSTDWVCDVSPLLPYVNDLATFGLGERVVGKSKTAAVRNFHKKVVAVLVAGGFRVEAMLTPVQIAQFKFGYCVGLLIGDKLVNTFGSYQRLYLCCPFFVRSYLDSLYCCGIGGYVKVTKNWKEICKRYLYGEPFDNLNLILGTGFRLSEDDMDSIVERDDRQEVDLLMGGFG